MYAHIRLHLFLAVLFAVVLIPRPAWAWVELGVRSHQATLDLDRSGLAVVTHDLVLEVRGGPMHGFDLPGVDSDAEVLPEATVAATSAHASGVIPLVVEKKEDGSLRIEVSGDSGLRRGTYLFHFAYRTKLVDRARLTAEGVEVVWVGPRLWDGIDAAKSVFRIPRALQPPALVEGSGDRSAASDSDDAAGGVFVSNLRRSSDKDELEIVRLHVARGEPVVWKLRVSPDAFDAFQKPVAPSAAASAVRVPERRASWLLVAGLLALLYAIAVWLKDRWYAKACALCSATPRTLVPVRSWQRALGAGTALGAAVFVGATTESASGAAALLVIAMLGAAQLSPRAIPRVRGPGSWHPIDAARAFARPKRLELPGRWLDSGTLPGFASFVVLVVGFVVLAQGLLAVSPYRALLVLLGASALLPIFCTGRASELPADPAAMPRPLLRWLAKRVGRAGLEATPLGRIPDGSTDPDELRLLVKPKRSLPGLLALEVGLEYQQGGGGPVSMPCVLVRVIDGSDSYKALPRNVVWTRGRSAGERVTVLRPRLPTRSQCLSLVLRLSVLLSDRARPAAQREPAKAPTQRPLAPTRPTVKRIAFSRTAAGGVQPSRSADTSAGKGSSTEKPGISASPAHAT